jgi:hypothetical protein
VQTEKNPPALTHEEIRGGDKPQIQREGRKPGGGGLSERGRHSNSAPAGESCRREKSRQPARPDTPRTKTRQRRRNQREQNTATKTKSTRAAVHDSREGFGSSKWRTLHEIHRKEDTRRGCFEAKTRTDDRTRPGGVLREKPV